MQPMLKIDKRLDIHLQDYVNYKDANLLSHNGLEERIDHKVYSSHTNINGNSSEISITPALTGKYIIVFVDSLGANPAWYKAGYLIPFFDDNTIGRVYGKSKFCGLRRHTFIKLTDWEFLNPFVFKPVPWLIDVQIKIWSTGDYALYDQEDRVEERLNEVYNILQN